MTTVTTADGIAITFDGTSMDLVAVLRAIRRAASDVDGVAQPMSKDDEGFVCPAGPCTDAECSVFGCKLYEQPDGVECPQPGDDEFAELKNTVACRVCSGDPEVECSFCGGRGYIRCDAIVHAPTEKYVDGERNGLAVALRWRPSLPEYAEDDLAALRQHVENYVSAVEADVGARTWRAAHAEATMTVRELLQSLRTMTKVRMYERLTAEERAARPLCVHTVTTKGATRA